MLLFILQKMEMKLKGLLTIWAVKRGTGKWYKTGEYLLIKDAWYTMVLQERDKYTPTSDLIKKSYFFKIQKLWKNNISGQVPDSWTNLKKDSIITVIQQLQQ